MIIIKDVKNSKHRNSFFVISLLDILSIGIKNKITEEIERIIRETSEAVFGPEIKEMQWQKKTNEQTPKTGEKEINKILDFTLLTLLKNKKPKVIQPRKKIITRQIDKSIVSQRFYLFV